MLDKNMIELSLEKLPLKIKNAVLMSQGIWNNIYYDKAEINKAFSGTDWNSRERKNLFLDHKDQEASEWLGEVDNMHFEDDTLYGDLSIYDPIWAAKLKYGKPKVGISPKVKGDVNDEENSMSNFVFENFSLVINPAVKTAFINNMEVLKMETDIDKILEPEAKDAGKSTKADAEKDILLAAEKILKERKRASESTESLEDIFDLIEKESLKDRNIAEIINKAKEMKTDDKSWKVTLKEAIKMAEEEEKKEEEAKPEEEATEEKPAEEVPTEEAPKEEAPAEEAPPKEETSETEQKMKDLEAKVKELSEKLNEPERIELKESRELAEEDPDKGMMKYLRKLTGVEYHVDA